MSKSQYPYINPNLKPRAPPSKPAVSPPTPDVPPVVIPQTEPPLPPPPPPVNTNVVSAAPPIRISSLIFNDTDEQQPILERSGTIGKKRKREVIRMDYRKRIHANEPWSHHISDTNLLSRFTNDTTKRHGRNFADLMKSEEMVNAYNPPPQNFGDNDEDEGVTPVIHGYHLGGPYDFHYMRIGPQSLPDDFVIDGDNAVENVHVIDRNSLTKEDAERYNIDVESTIKNRVSSHLRREILTFLAKSKQANYQFMELLAAAFGPPYTTDDFIWLFPQDIVNLSRKDPYILKHQNYNAGDFLRELMHLFAINYNDPDDFGKVLAYVRAFVSGWSGSDHGPDQPDDGGGPARPAFKGSSSSNRSGRTRNPETQTILQPPFVRETTPLPNSPSSSSSSSARPDRSQSPGSGPRGEDPNRRPVINPGIEDQIRQVVSADWLLELDQFLQPDFRRAIFKNDIDSTDVPLGLLLVKPTVRGMIRIAHSKINVEARKDFTTEELMFSKAVAPYFAGFIALTQGIASSIMGNGAGLVNPVGLGHAMSQINGHVGNINVYNSRQTRYTMNFQMDEKIAAIDLFTKVYRSTAFDGKTTLQIRLPAETAESRNTPPTAAQRSPSALALQDTFDLDALNGPRSRGSRRR